MNNPLRLCLMACVFGAGLLGCGGGVIQRVGELPPPPPGKGFLHIECSVSGAEIFVDDAFRGEVSRYRDGVVSLPVGPHRIALKADKHYSWYGEIEISERPSRLTIELVPEI